MSKKAERKTRWMAGYEERLIRLVPETANRIDWDMAAYWYSQGLSSFNAATRSSATETQGMAT